MEACVKAAVDAAGRIDVFGQQNIAPTTTNGGFEAGIARSFANAPGAEVVATGSWPKLIVTRAGSSQAPNGTYRLVIAHTVTFPISLN